MHVDTQAYVRTALKSSSLARIWRLYNYINIFIVKIKPQAKQQERDKVDPTSPFRVPTVFILCRRLMANSYQMPTLEAGELNPPLVIWSP